jgi:hypothetical protein
VRRDACQSAAACDRTSAQQGTATVKDRLPGSIHPLHTYRPVGLANALIAHYHEGVHNAFDELDSRIQSLSISALADFLLDLMVDLHKDAGPTIKRLLEIPEVLSVKRGEFRRSIHKHIVRTLTLRSPGLTSDKAHEILPGIGRPRGHINKCGDLRIRPCFAQDSTAPGMSNQHGRTVLQRQHVACLGNRL